MPRRMSTDGRPIHNGPRGPLRPDPRALVLYHDHLRTAAGVPIDGERCVSLLSRYIDDVVARFALAAGNS
jgi:hypothetical protein